LTDYVICQSIRIVLAGSHEARNEESHSLSASSIGFLDGKLLTRQVHRPLHDIEMVVVYNAAWKRHFSRPVSSA
jgi:hypothetical protein